jgi:hypothetical protein
MEQGLEVWLRLESKIVQMIQCQQIEHEDNSGMFSPKQTQIQCPKKQT